MAETTVTTMNFYDNHIPSLRDGEYMVEFSQSLSLKDQTTEDTVTASYGAANDPNPQSIAFRVAGPRFLLDNALVHTVFPPKGGKADYRGCLPSISLNRSTLPWERTALYGTTDESIPWLFLLLIDESEDANVTEKNNATLSDFKELFISSESGTTPLSADDLARYPTKVNLLEVDPSLIMANTPSPNTSTGLIPNTIGALKYMNYADIKTQTTGANPPLTLAEKAVVLGNRLPQAGHNSTVYLISLENCYTGSGDTATFQGIQSNDKYIFPYLHKWSFHALDDKLYYINTERYNKINHNFAKANPPITTVDVSSLQDALKTSTSELLTALKNLNPPLIPVKNASTQKEKTDNAAIKIIEQNAALPGSTFHSLLSNLSGGFAPFCTAGSSGIETSGTVKLTYQKANLSVPANPSLDSTNSWYRGPLAAFTIDLSTFLPHFPFIGDTPAIPTSADDLLIKDTTNNTMDNSYAAAYELGRLTALDDADFSTAFFQWKSEKSMEIRLAAIKAMSGSGYKNIMHLPVDDAPAVGSMPQKLQDKFASWRALNGIPYRYLVPDSSLLPSESIRFFRLDNKWVNAFLCGAFSIGHTVEADLSVELKKVLLNTATVTNPTESKPDVYTGFFINSMVVSGWPDYVIDALNAAGTPISLVRKENLDVNSRMYLIKGEFTHLEFYLPQNKMHSGFVYNAGSFTKPLKDSSPIAFNDNHTFDIDSLVSTLGATSVAEFAKYMIESVPTVNFEITPAAS